MGKCNHLLAVYKKDDMAGPGDIWNELFPVDPDGGSAQSHDNPPFFSGIDCAGKTWFSRLDSVMWR